MEVIPRRFTPTHQTSDEADVELDIEEDVEPVALEEVLWPAVIVAGIGLVVLGIVWG